MPFARVIEAVASEKQEEWTAFRDRYGDGGRDLALWRGRRLGGMTLSELGAAAGGVSAAAVSEAIRRPVRSAPARAYREGAWRG